MAVLLVESGREPPAELTSEWQPQALGDEGGCRLRIAPSNPERAELENSGPAREWAQLGNQAFGWGCLGACRAPADTGKSGCVRS